MHESQVLLSHTYLLTLYGMSYLHVHITWHLHHQKKKKKKNTLRNRRKYQHDINMKLDHHTYHHYHPLVLRVTSQKENYVIFRLRAINGSILNNLPSYSTLTQYISPSSTCSCVRVKSGSLSEQPVISTLQVNRCFECILNISFLLHYIMPLSDFS